MLALVVSGSLAAVLTVLLSLFVTPAAVLTPVLLPPALSALVVPFALVGVAVCSSFLPASLSASVLVGP